MEKYDITGMSCAACSARVEKAVSKLDGVEECSVNLLTNSMAVKGSASSDKIIKAVENAGYGASLHTGNASPEHKDSSDELKDTETPKMVKRLVFSVLLLLPLMYLSMGHTMWGWPVPAFLENNPVGLALFQLLFTAAVMLINKKFFISGFKGLVHRAPNMDTLVALGSGAAFVYSTVILFVMTVQLSAGNIQAAMEQLHSNMYYESSAMILTLITVGKTLEAYSKGKTTDALKSLMKLAPDTATVIRDGKEVRINAADVEAGDIFIVKAGEAFPVDGVILKGESAVDESALTGESIPVDKKPGDRISAATINKNGFLECRATSVGKDTAISKIIQMVSDASATKAPIARAADKVSGVFVPAVIVISVITMLAWLIAGESAGFILSRGISVLVISCPCALGLATPVAIMVGSGKGAKNGILFKTAASLEQCGKTDIVCLDKTGTITEGDPSVTDIVSDEPQKLLEAAFSAESKSEHPLAKAVVKYCKEKDIKLSECSDVKILAGSGLSCSCFGRRLFAGNSSLISENAVLPESMLQASLKLSDEGKTPLFFAFEDEFLGIIAVADTVKSSAQTAVTELGRIGVAPVMITGDTQKTAAAIAARVGIKRVIAKVLPQGKEETVRLLSKQGSVAMVGDGINDAPALTRADTGIAIGAGTDVAIDAADVVLMHSDPLDIPKAINLSRRVMLNIKENLFWAFFYNTIGIPVAAGVLEPAFGITLNPMIAAAAMSLSSFCVVMNALRLNFADLKKPVHKRKRKEDIDMGIFSSKKAPYIEIEGMMCEHCEAHVTKALADIGLTVRADHNANKAYIESGDAQDSDIKAAVESAGYKYIKTVR